MTKGFFELNGDLLRVLIPESRLEKYIGIVDSIDDADGMLFTKPGKYFTMEHTKIPLKIHFIDAKGGHLDSIDGKPNSTEPIPVPEGCAYVLEIPASGLEKEALTPYQLMGRGSKLAQLRKLMLKAIAFSSKTPRVKFLGRSYGGPQLSKTLYNNAEVLPLMGLVSPLPGPAFMIALPYLAAKHGVKSGIGKLLINARKAQYHKAIRNRDVQKLFEMGKIDSKRGLSLLESKLPSSYRMALETQKDRSKDLSALLRRIIEEGERRGGEYLGISEVTPV